MAVGLLLFGKALLALLMQMPGLGKAQTPALDIVPKEAARGGTNIDWSRVGITRHRVAARDITGDLWTSTWAADDSLFFAWGDGTGQSGCIPTSNDVTPLEQIHWKSCGDGTFSVDSKCLPADWDCTGPASVCRFLQCDPPACYPLCRLARAGVRRDRGPVTALSACRTPITGDVKLREDSCIVDRDPPDHDLTADNKFSSLIVLDNKLYGHMHSPCCHETSRGFLVAGDEKGWTTLARPGDPKISPWDENSHFRVGMFIQMGRNHSLSRDGYVYMLGIDREILESNSPVYLARVPKAKIGDPTYKSWEYFTSKGGNYRFVTTQASATPVLGDLGTAAHPGGGTMAQGSALYHPYLNRYLFLTGSVDVKASDNSDVMPGALYMARKPWGPWSRIRSFTGAENRGGIFGLIAKDMGPNCVYFSYAGLPYAKLLTYTFKVDALVFETPCGQDSDCGCGSTCQQGLCKVR